MKSCKVSLYLWPQLYITSLTEHCKYIIHCCENRVLESYSSSVNQTTVSGPSNQPKNNPCVSAWGNQFQISVVGLNGHCSWWSISTWITPVAPKFACLLDYILVRSQPRTKLILPFTTMASSDGNGC